MLMTLSERELALMDEARAIRSITITVRFDRPGEDPVFGLAVTLGDGDPHILLNYRRRPRLWRSLDTIYRFLRNTCPNTEQVHLALRETA